MKVLISGATGLVGSALFEKLSKEGHTIHRLVRTVANQSGMDVVWDPVTDKGDLWRLEGYDAIIHLAGESIASGRWNEKKKQRIRDSRVVGTGHLAHHLSLLKQPPKVFIVASAIGFYGDRKDENLDEQSKVGTGFLSEVCQAWEAATAPVSKKGIRTVNLRFGIILSPKGGALKTMLCPFKMGVGGMLGNGKQYMSWVALDDVIGAIEKSIADPSLQGAVNVVSPSPVTNAEYTNVLGAVLSRPTLLPVPAFGARLVMGEMADALLLASTKVLPKKLEAAGYKFKYPTLEPALRYLLSR